MVDLSDKLEKTQRVARATSKIFLGKDAFMALIGKSPSKKGDVFSVARVAGIQAAKQTSHMIPLCHPLLLDHVRVDLELDDSKHAILVDAEVRCKGTTGVEMEALTAAAVASLTVYDMCKSASKDIRITDLQLEHKRGGRSGTYDREPS